MVDKRISRKMKQRTNPYWYSESKEIRNDIRFLLAHDTPIPPRPTNGKKTELTAWRKQITELTDDTCEKAIVEEEKWTAEWIERISTMTPKISRLNREPETAKRIQENSQDLSRSFVGRPRIKIV